MTAVLKQARTDSTEKNFSEGERRCLVSGAMKPRAEMIRFVIGPEAVVVPDLSEKLPGSGMWVSARQDLIQDAAKKNLFAKFSKTEAHPSKTLAQDVAALLRKRCLQLLGLAKGAGITILGEAQTEAALRAGKLALHLHADDAARALDNRRGVPLCGLFSRLELGEALGFEQLVYAGLTAHGLTEKLIREIGRLQLMTTSEKSEG